VSAPASSELPSYRGYRYLAEIISYAVWLYFRFSLSVGGREILLPLGGHDRTALCRSNCGPDCGPAQPCTDDGMADITAALNCIAAVHAESPAALVRRVTRMTPRLVPSFNLS